MISLENYSLFIGACFLLLIVPGPDMAYILSRSILQGKKAGLVASVAVNTGGYVHLLAAVLGLSAILATSSFAFTTIKWLGACYLIWLGFQAIFAKSGVLEIDGASKHNKFSSIFWQGLLVDLLNPKVALFYLAFLPQFVSLNGTNEITQLLLLGVTLNILALVFNLLLVFFSVFVTDKISNNRQLSCWLSRVMGALFISLGIKLANERF